MQTIDQPLNQPIDNEAIGYYYNTDRRNAELCVCTCGMEHRMNGYSWGPAKSGAPYYDMCHLIKGSGIYTLDGVDYVIRAGDTFVAYPMQEQCIRSDGETEWEYVWVGMNGNTVPQLLQRMGFSESAPVVYTGASEQIKSLHRAMHDNRGNSLSEILCMTGYLFQIFSVLIKATDSNKRTVPDLLERALNYIHAHYHEELRVQDICRAVNTSRSWLYRSFKENVGFSPLDYINHQRIMRSCYYLADSNLSIAEIAAKCGFQDPLYFSRQFSQVMGLSPTKFRKTSGRLKSSNNASNDREADTDAE